MSEQVRVQPARSPMARLIGVIMSPRETFEEITARPGWVFPFICYLVLFGIAFGAYAAKADWVAIVTDQIEGSPVIKMLPEEAQDRAVQEATKGVRERSQIQNAIGNLANIGLGLTFFIHGMALVYCTLFVLMGSLKDLKLGRAWLNFLLCLTLLVAYIAVAWIAEAAFGEAPSSALLLTATTCLLVVAAWIWLLNTRAAADIEYHRMLSVCSYSTVVSMVGGLAILVIALVHQGPIQVGMESVVKSNLGALLKPENPALRALLDSLDVFVLWFLIVLTVGFRAATRLSTGMAASITFLPWGIWVLLKIAFKAAFA